MTGSWRSAWPRPGRSDRRAADRPGGRAHTGLQHGVPPEPTAGDRWLRSAVPDRRRRRGHLLANAATGLDARVPPGRHRVASPARNAAHLLEAAGGVWQGRSDPRAQVAGEVQRRRPHQLGGAPVRVGARAGDSVASRQAVPGHLGRGPVPVPVPAGAGDLRRAPPDAGVVPRDPGPRGAVLRARERVAPSPGRVAAPGSRRGSAPAPGDARRGARPLHLSRPIVQRAAQALRPDGAPVPPPAVGAAAWPSCPRPAPWRRRGTARSGSPWPQTVALWRPRGRTAAEHLGDISQTLREAGAAVRPGGDFDRWDLEVRLGGLGVVRVLMATEEHGAGRQLLRFRIQPWVPPAWLVLVTFEVRRRSARRPARPGWRR